MGVSSLFLLLPHILYLWYYSFWSGRITRNMEKKAAQRELCKGSSLAFSSKGLRVRHKATVRHAFLARTVTTDKIHLYLKQLNHIGCNYWVIKIVAVIEGLCLTSIFNVAFLYFTPLQHSYSISYFFQWASLEASSWEAQLVAKQCLSSEMS